jgi:hypothetical protein
VGEEADAQIGTRVGDHAGHERQLVVLHEHDVTMGRTARDGVGEGLVDRHVGVPRLAEVVVEAGPVHEVEHPVVEEPQHLVRHHAVVHP